MLDHDEQLIAKFRSTGRIEDLNELFARHLGRVRQMVYSMVLDQEAADDVTQDVFLRVVRGIKRFDGRAQFSTWLYRISMNATHSFLERRNRSPVELREEADDIPSRTVGVGEQVMLQQELTAEIQQALNKLSARLRAAIVLVGIQQVPAATAAEIEDCSIDTMYWRVHEARTQLKEHLKEYLS